MDSVQAVEVVEPTAKVEAVDQVLPVQQETEEPAPAQERAAEMGELPVEDWDYQQPKRGQVRTGVILAIRDQEIVVDIGAKRDGIVPYADMQRLGPEALAELHVGDEVPVYILRPEDQDGNLLVSLNMARQEKAWMEAQELAERGELIEGRVIGYNKGGLVFPVGDIRGFIPASQVPGFPQGLSQEQRLQRLSQMVGETFQAKIIEINKRKRRLILSATAAQREWRQQQRERLLAELREGEVRRGVVSSLCPFGAFVDLGGADGLIHLSELSWRRVRHPREVLKVGQEVEVYVLRLDREKKRIALSLKRLQPEPWSLVEDKYELGQLVEGTVTNVVDFGAFARIEDGVEGLIHISELAEGPVSHPREVVKKGDLLLLRIIRIDTRRKRLGLSLKRVLESEWAEWAAKLAAAEEAESAPPEALPAEEAAPPEMPPEEVAPAEEAAAPETASAGEAPPAGEAAPPGTAIAEEAPPAEEAALEAAPEDQPTAQAAAGFIEASLSEAAEPETADEPEAVMVGT